MALPSEIGLYFDFEVTEDGVPYGCPGFETFNPEYWKTSYAAKWSRVPKVDNPNPNTNWHWKKADPECPFNTMAIPDGSTPLHQIFEEYASDQQKWVNDFVPTLEKMLSNGYKDDDLVDAPDQYTGIQCTRQGRLDGSNYYNCNNPGELDESEAFFIISRLHGRVVEGKPNGYGKIMPFNSNDPKQKWMETSIGNLWQIIFLKVSSIFFHNIDKFQYYTLYFFSIGMLFCSSTFSEGFFGTTTISTPSELRLQWTLSASTP